VAVPTIGENLRRVRKTRRIGQVTLAERSGVSQPTISGIETGGRDPHPSTLRKLAEVLDVPVATFFEEAEAPKAPHTAMPSEDFDELRREASTGQLDGEALLEAIQREYDALAARYRSVLDKGEAGLDEALELMVEARKRWRVVMFDRLEETVALDEKRDPTVAERADTRLLPLDEADDQLRAAMRTRV
jgi:transcriptional regulator with XRE-family HTH domain